MTGSVAEQLGNNRSEMVKMNRHYIRTVAEILLLCSQQDISLRGHDESNKSLNKGNFKEFLSVVANHDTVVAKKLQQGPRNAVYTSPKIQNEILNIMANMVRQQICTSIQQTGYYSILADETKDMSKNEQLSIVVRYVEHDGNNPTVVERFLTFVVASNLTAEYLTLYILDTLSLFSLDVNMIVSQGYDGASVMSGCCSGVQQRIRELVPHAIYIHCHAHCLNLVLVDCVKSNSAASEFFTVVQSLYTFMSTSKAHVVYLEIQNQLHPDQQNRQLQRLSDTRWACRYLSLDVICSTFDSVLATLESIANGDDKAKAIEAVGLLHQVNSFKFLSCLVIFHRLLGLTKSLSDQLQSRDIDLCSASELIESTIGTLKSFRNEDTWKNTFEYIKTVADLHHIDMEEVRPIRQRRRPQRMEDFISETSTGQREPLNNSQSLKQNIYFPVIDLLLTEIGRRFNSTNIGIMKSVQACNPSSSTFLDPSQLASLASFYNLDTDLLATECLLAKRTLLGPQQNESIESVIDVYRLIIPLEAAFPTLKKLLQISLTLAVSTAQCERSFSALKRIKTYLRTTMTEQRLTDISILSIERELSKKISLDTVVSKFEGIDKNRSIVLSFNKHY